jgi:uncharacterized membrane protein (DUF106 family)
MAFLDPVLGWALLFHPFVAILILAFIVTMISNLIYKYTTDQREMKRLKEQIEDYRKKIKEARDNPKKMMKLNQDAMSVNMQYLTKSLKPMLFTFIPIIVIFAWMNAHFTYAELAAGEPLIITAGVNDGFSGELVLTSETLDTKELTSPITTVDGRNVAAFAVRGSAGTHNFSIAYNGDSYGGNSGAVVFGENPGVTTFPGKGPIEKVNGIVVEYPRVRPLGGFRLGSWYPGWIFIYIILSIALSVGTRKLMKIY